MNKRNINVNDDELKFVCMGMFICMYFNAYLQKHLHMERHVQCRREYEEQSRIVQLRIVQRSLSY